MTTLTCFNTPTPSPARLLGAITLGGVITFGLFAVMAKLVAQDDTPLVVSSMPVIPNPVLQLEDEKTIVRPTLPKREKPQTPPPPSRITSDPIEVTMGEPNIGTGFTGIDKITIDNDFSSGLSDQQARPVVQIEPAYPPDAARDGIEGWVSLSFTIDALGGVKDITIIDAEPARVFNREARRALARWKYRPKVVEGNAVSQPDMRVLLTFRLDQ
ncbi:TonB family protein [Alteromonas sp. H39]|uniref:energy transducer TonB n=1 Tax=Alteromonas sp. H39 TaxID=3389876 RepID=UPI0039DF4565